MTHGRLHYDLMAIGLLALAVFLGLSLASYDPADPPAHVVYPEPATASNLCGQAGAILSHLLLSGFGWGSYALLAALVVVDARLFTKEECRDPLTRMIGGVLVLAAICTACQLLVPDRAAGPLVGSGGYLGTIGTALLHQHFSLVGSMILTASVMLAGLLLSGEVRVVHWVISLCLLPITIWSKLGLVAPSPPEPVATDFANLDEASSMDADSNSLDEVDVQEFEASDEPPIEVDFPISKPGKKPKEVAAEPSTRHIKVNPPITVKKASSAPPKPDAEPKEYELPTLDLLDDAEEFPYEVLAQKAQLAAATLEKTFQEFGLNVKVVEIDTGPVITQFELELEAGLRLSKVTALADDLAIALRVPSVRVVAPIPGKNTVGVEVPNEVRVMVRLRELIESCSKDFADKRIPIYLGKDVSGKPLVVDMTKMPHLLIAGRTGTGKSVCLNTLILSMLMTRSPDQVKMLMIDPKMVELSPYSRIPHLMHPVITDMKKAEAVLGWAVDKMEERYDLLARVGVRHLDSYNKLGKETVLQRLEIDPDSEEAEQIPEHMPYIVIIADEMADMMMTSGKDVEGHIIRLAQKSRAVGIHLVLATQKPTVDVITGLIKSNLPARISFQVASRVDSRVVLDEMGADKLLGNGDMLYLAPGNSTLNRAQGTFVSDDEVNKVIAAFEGQEPEYAPELVKLKVTSKDGKGSKDSETGGLGRDDMYEQAVEVVIREGRGSVSLLQRALGVGYGRGARLIDYMAEDGVVGTYNGSQAREVVMTMEEWEEYRAEKVSGTF